AATAGARITYEFVSVIGLKSIRYDVESPRTSSARSAGRRRTDLRTRANVVAAAVARMISITRSDGIAWNVRNIPARSQKRCSCVVLHDAQLVKSERYWATT